MSVSAEQHCGGLEWGGGWGADPRLQRGCLPWMQPLGSLSFSVCVLQHWAQGSERPRWESPSLFLGRGSREDLKNPGDKGTVLPPGVQVNLMRKMRVMGVVTQGASRAGSAEYLKTFKVAYSDNGHKFQFIQGAEGTGDKVRALKKGCGPHPLGL